MKTNTAAMERVEYLYVVNGVIPEAMPIAAYRRARRPELAGRKLIKCPYCRGHLTDVDRNTLVRLFCKPKNDRHKAIPGQIFKQCDICKGEVGMVMV